MKPRSKIAFIIVALVIAGGCTLLFNIFYRDAENAAIAKLNQQQLIHAREVALGIEDFFETWIRSLNSLSQMDAIISGDDVGKRYLQLYHQAHHEQIMGITRVNENGLIVDRYPARDKIGSDLSKQMHIKELLRDHRPVVSNVFKTIDGVDAVALHVPVFQSGEFKGSIGVLINFEDLARRYLDSIRISQTGYAWVIDREGTVLYTPNQAYIGKPVFSVLKNNDALGQLVKDMLAGHEGVARYRYDRLIDRKADADTKYVAYIPVRLGPTFWSICIASSERDVFAELVTFRNKLAAVIGGLFVCGMVFAILGAKAWLIVKEEDKRRMAEAKLRESEARFRSVADTAPVMIWMSDTDKRCSFFNQGWLQFTGRTFEQEFGNGWIEGVHPEDAEHCYKIYSTSFDARESFTMEYRLRRKDRSYGWVLDTGTPRFSSDNVFLGYIGSCIDISERKDSELEAQRHRAELAHLSRVALMGEMAASLAHELNQPLTAITTNSAVGRRLIDSARATLPELRELLADINGDAYRASEVVRGIRTMVKKGEPSREQINMNDVVTNVVKMAHSDAVHRSCQLQVSLATDLPPIEGDAIQLQQVLLNLVINGFDAMSDTPVGKRKVMITTDSNGNGTIQVSVRDGGCGIPNPVRENLFTPFFTTKAEGLGMGLVIVRSIIESHGGTIQAENAIDGGALFHFTLPGHARQHNAPIEHPGTR
jgi:PAS domain S-box-containing protein